MCFPLWATVSAVGKPGDLILVMLLVALGKCSHLWVVVGVGWLTDNTQDGDINA